MRYLLLVLVPMLLVGGTYWEPRGALKSGFSVEHLCKRGVQIVRFTKGSQVFEQPYCYDQSSWDGDCAHPPIRCYEKSTPRSQSEPL